jgi:quercetin dioxygenase-like cupin family protein
MYMSVTSTRDTSVPRRSIQLSLVLDQLVTAFHDLCRTRLRATLVSASAGLPGILLSVLVSSVDAAPANGAVPTRQTPAEISWPAASGSQAGSSMQTAVESAVVFGDATKPGLYSIMFRVRPDAKIPAHSHPDDRSCFVTNGVWYFGYGNQFTESALRALPAGSHYTEPANVNHFAATHSEGATAECTSIGPSGTVFSKSADDPRR